ncbi:putative G-protein coupled receptor 156 [Aplochiton taeniatus]
MALATSLLSEEQFLCPICLDVFSHPVTTPCGHNFCRDCIRGYWQSTSQCQCPMCKHKFYLRPELRVNTFISEMATQFRKSVERRTSGDLDRAPAQPGEVPCDVCTESRVKARKSCLDCLASYCEVHLEPHHILASFKKHQLMEPVMSVQDRVCQKHDRLLELFCRTDQTFVCQFCRKSEHKAHHTVGIEKESTERKAQLEKAEAEVQRLIQGRLQRVCEVKRALQLGRGNAERETEEVLRVFSALVSSLQRSQAELVDTIEAKQSEAERRAQLLITELELEIEELSRRSAELERLSRTQDHLHLLQRFPVVSKPPPTMDLCESSPVHSVVYVGTMRRAFRRAGSQLEETLKAEMGMELPKRSLSTALCAVLWTLLSSGILLAFGFLLFTLRFKNNRIVKMSSPNLNVLTLCGSVLTYSSGFLFAVEEATHPQGGVSRAVLQAQMWTLCIGSTLVFGPILGKTWRLYRVFTQRVPDKRVIIRDIQLMGLVGLLILVDLLVLTAWNLTDPLRCTHSVGALVKVVEKDVSYSLTQMDSCSSVYSDLWIILLAGLKGSLLLYGTYLAGLTSNVSLPPVNQSPTIMTAVVLVTLSTAVALPVCRFLQAWPNLVYSTVAGSIFICTLATNCLLFIPQLTQWRQFEEEHNNPSQMAKYFSSPSKSLHSVYSQDEVYFLLGQNNSMKRLLNEKNAVIDSLQEQVKNAKDKLLRIMSASHPQDDHDMDSSTTNLNSSSTHTTVVQSETPDTPLPLRDTESVRSSSPLCETPPAFDSIPPPSAPPSPPEDAASQSGHLLEVNSDAGQTGSQQSAAKSQLPSFPNTVVLQCTELRPAVEREAAAPTALNPTLNFVTSSCIERRPSHTEPLGCHTDPTLPWVSGRQKRFVSSEQLQEILQELSVNAVMETALRSPSRAQASRRPSQPNITATSPLFPLSPLSLRNPLSPPPPFFFRYPSISPYAMRKRRPPFHSPRGGPLPCFFPGSEPPSWGRKRNSTPGALSLDKQPVNSLCPDDSDMEEEEQEAYRVPKRCGRRVCRPDKPIRRGPIPPYGGQGDGAPSEGEGVSKGAPCRKHGRDSCGYWDSDSSSSADYCYYHRPYCDSCLQHGTYLSSDSSSDSSDSEYGGPRLFLSKHPVVFKEDLKPTFV